VCLVKLSGAILIFVFFSIFYSLPTLVKIKIIIVFYPSVTGTVFISYVYLAIGLLHGGW